MKRPEEQYFLFPCSGRRLSLTLCFYSLLKGKQSRRRKGECVVGRSAERASGHTIDFLYYISLQWGLINEMKFTSSASLHIPESSSAYKRLKFIYNNFSPTIHRYEEINCGIDRWNQIARHQTSALKQHTFH